VLGAAAAELRSRAASDRVAAAIDRDLADADRGFTPAKLHLHRTVALRAIGNAGLL
jgi:hypothetical protein